MGDVYVIEEGVRRSIAEVFPKNKIIVFPQTIHFSKTKRGRDEMKKTVKSYDGHKNLTLIARESVSYDIMRKDFVNNKVLLTPDIVLSMDYKKRYSRKGALMCIRSDVEGKLTALEKEKLNSWLGDRFQDVRYTDTVTYNRFYFLSPRRFIVAFKLRQFAHAEFVVTDRLHGMVFAAITGTPCIVFSNFNHKVKGVYEWVKDLGYIQYCESTKDLEKIDIEKLMDDAKIYDPGTFDKYWDLIRSEIKSK